MPHAINSAVNFYNAGVVTRDCRIGSRLFFLRTGWRQRGPESRRRRGVYADNGLEVAYLTMMNFKTNAI
jgi:hypothetical protein